jgi:uncharacterized protein
MILFDVNVLIALGSRDHEGKAAAERYFCNLTTRFATCPITQTGFIRVLTQIDRALALTDGVAALGSICAHPKHQFIADDVDALELPWLAIQGHRQVTDAYLAALARKHGAKLATFDRALAVVHPDVAVLI